MIYDEQLFRLRAGQIGARGAVKEVIKRAYDSRDVDNAAAVGSLEQIWSDVAAPSDHEEMRVDVLTGLCLAYGRYGIGDILQKRLPVRRKAELVEARCAESKWPHASWGAAMFAVAATWLDNVFYGNRGSGAATREEASEAFAYLDILTSAMALDMRILVTHGEMYRYLDAMLNHNAAALADGVVAIEDDEYEEFRELATNPAQVLQAVRQGIRTSHLISALQSYTALALRSRFLFLLDELQITVLNGGSAAADVAAELMNGFILDAEDRFGTSAEERTQDLLRAVAGRVSTIDRQVRCHQLAKGCAFATSLLHPGPLDSNEELAQILSQSDAILGQVQAADYDESGYDDPDMYELLLGAYIGSSEREGGVSPAQRLSNVQRRFDEAHFRAVRRRGIGRTGTGHEQDGSVALEMMGDHVNPPGLLDVDNIAGSLDEHTVLLDIFLSQTDDGRLLVESTGLASRDFRCARIRWDKPVGFDVSGPEGQSYRLSGVARWVGAVRSAIAHEYLPPGRLVSGEAAAALAESVSGLLGDVMNGLRQWSAEGKTHLCVWPHGAAQYLPFHLIPTQPGILADDWTVTTIPALSLLARRPATPRRTGTFVSVCSSSSFFFSEGAKESLERQARLVAGAATPSTLLVNAQATPKAVLRGLEQARYAHIAAHGSHDLDAPAFQALYLADAGGNLHGGRLFAHEVSSADLRGLELVTLSACESALGRFDLAGNLRGLPAAFLGAGAGAVIGALWPIAPEPSETFFVNLYQQLARGANVRQAFQHAQSATRQAYPQYHHWGAFTFIGDAIRV
jgi:hypothetical protein